MLVNRSLMLMDLIGAEILLAFWVNGQVLHHQRVYLKGPDWLMDFNELLTRKLRLLLSVLNKECGGSEKIWLHSLRVVFFRSMTFFIVRSYWW